MRIPKWNAYQCSRCTGLTLTVDVDEGTTPMVIDCRATKDCDGSGLSLFYPKAPIPEGMKPEWEWYRPDPEERAKLAKTDPDTYEHVMMDGLLLRPRTDKEPVYYGE